MQDLEVDVAIVGAGIAGLAAAAELQRNGISLRVLEARERIGGRLASRRAGSLPVSVELGAEFVQGAPPELVDLLRTAGLAFVELTGDAYVSEAGRVSSWPRLRGAGRVEEALRSLRGEDLSLRAFVETRMDPAPSDEERDQAFSWTEGYDAAPPDRVSALSLAREQQAEAQIEGDRGFRVIGGYDGVAHWLRGALPLDAVALRSRVERISWRRGRAELTCVDPAGERTVTRARAAIVTVPLGVLRAGTLAFDPPLPGKDAAAQGAEMGAVIKLVLHFRTAFWTGADAAGLGRLGFLRVEGVPIPTWWSYYPVFVPLVVGWLGGPSAAAMSRLSDEAVVDRGLESFAAALGVPRAEVDQQLVGSYFHNWQQDPLALGAYSYVVTGGLAAQEELARPVDGTIFFAGEVTETSGHQATVHGALATGRRAATEVVQALRSP